MRLKHISTIFSSALLLAGCSDYLDKVPEGATLLQDQKNEAVEARPELLSADVAAMNADMIARYSVVSYHFDFGYATSCLMTDCNTADMTCANIGYNWFSPNSAYTDRVYTSNRTLYMWNFFYNQISSANLVIEPVPEDTEDPTLKAYRGMALAVRAFDYLNLAQLHQFTYIGHETLPCVPIVTEKTTSEEAGNNPRATVAAVYEQIMKDLNEAITLLQDYKRADKGYIDQGVAYGLRARANLLMGNYADAASDAEKALSLTGATPYTLSEVSVPAFYDASDNTVMWANIITETNSIVTSSIVNMPSHLCTFYTDGYVGVGAWKKISKLLYDKIPSTDIRKQWWLDEEENSTLCAGSEYDNWRAIASADDDFGAYTNVKFGADGGNLVTLTPAQDWFLMRAEEMLFIQAEGLAMSGNTAGAKTLLENFVKTYRDPSYTCNASTADALRDEIWFQRRVELWGEGFAFYDIMRLKKPIIRKENGVSSFPAAYQFNIEAEAPILLWRIPKTEIEANKGISEEDNNEAAPTPVAD